MRNNIAMAMLLFAMLFGSLVLPTECKYLYLIIDPFFLLTIRFKKSLSHFTTNNNQRLCLLFKGNVGVW